MLVKEMHIGVNLLLEKVNSNFIDSIEPEELDWALNEEVLRFIKQRINPKSNDKQQGFQDNQKRFEDLKPLIVPVTLPSYTNDSNTVFSHLPADYLIRINDRSTVKDLCGESFSTVGTTNINKYVSCITIKDDTGLFAYFKIVINGTTVFDITNYPSISTGLPSIESKFELFLIVKKALTDLGFDCKYGKYYDVDCGQGITIVSDTPLVITVEYSLTDINLMSSITQVLNKLNQVSATFEISNRFVSTEIFYKLLASSFGTTISYSPLSTMEGNKIIVAHNQKFIPTTIKLSYLRKPRKISLSLNQDCDLDDWIQSEIVDNTAKRLAGLLESNGYKNIINENLLKE